MNILEISDVEIEGIVACLPENIVNNKEKCVGLFGDKVDNLIKATGINARCIADVGTTALDLGVEAAKELMKRTKTFPEEIGAVICVTFTPEYLMPADAPGAQARLGLSNYVLAFDINMACSGYGYGLYVASSLANSLNKKVLLLDGDVQSAYVSKLDKSTVPVLADAGTATLISPSKNSKKWKFSFLTVGEKREALFIPAGGSKRPMKNEDLDYIEYDDGSKRRESDIYMDGFEIFKFVAQDVSKFIQKFINTIELKPEDINAFIPHQANIYMIEKLSKKLKIPKDKLWKSGDVFGNPSSASVPLTIAKNTNEWFENNVCDEVLITGFGGGLSVSVANIQLKKEGFYSVINYDKGE